MNDAPSRAIRLYGTDEPLVAPRLLKAGPLTAELENGNLRYVRYDGIEMLRAISFIVRDRNWATYNPQITGLTVTEDADGFRVAYDAVTSDAAQSFRYSALITGRADGRLRFEGRGVATTDFMTNRTGFVILHPITGVAGAPARIETVDGEVRETRFPDMIDPVQPMKGLRAITHEFAPGASVTCRMEGDTYEMEDQRNWTDASYKTYVRPLALPWPYPLAAGTEVEQAITLTVQGRPGSAASARAATTLKLGAPRGTVPRLGLGLDPDDAAAALARADTLRAAAPAYLVCRHDTSRGHDRASLAQAVEVARAIGAEPWLEAVITSVDGHADEVAALGRTVRELGSPFPVVLVSPAPDLKCTLPGSVWPPCPPAEDLMRAARAAFPGARLGGGMFSYFTELNRKRPPLDLIDVVTFTTSGLVHAGDDRSVTEGLEALPHIARSVRGFIGDRPYVVGPSAMGMRDNPYGAAPMANPHNIRQAMNGNDPRQRGLLGAAWYAGYFARFAYGGAEAVALGGAVGRFGIVHAPAGYPQPWYDESGAPLHPAFHVVRGLAALAGAQLLDVGLSAPRNVQALAARQADGTLVLWLANLTSEPQRVALEPAVGAGSVAILDEQSFASAARSASAMDDTVLPHDGTELTLNPYAVARIVAS
ncbi:MAG: hypothetical protein JSR59_00440 [Proteobacteria bacterium]|nr:hypothetical protein [Pseudomonadota bacterium]